MICHLSEKVTNQREGLLCFDNGHLAAQHYFHIAIFAFFCCFYLWKSKLPDIFHETSSCSMCDDGLPFFEISAINADKPPLSIAEIKRCVEQFRKAGMSQCHVHCQLYEMTSYCYSSKSLTRLSYQACKHSSIAVTEN